MSIHVDAVVVDLDLTLCRTTQDRSAMLARAFERAGVEQYCTTEDLAAVVDDIDGADSDIDFYRRSLRAAGERAGVDAPYERIARAFDDLVDHSQVEPLPGAIEAVEYATDRYPTALLTNGGEETQRTKLRALGLEGAFDAHVFGDPDRGLKPDPAPFEAVLAELDRPADRALKVGDSVEADVRGANAVGMHSAWVPPGDAPENPAHEPTYRLESLAALPSLLE